MAKDYSIREAEITVLNELLYVFLRALEFDGDDPLQLITEWNYAIARVQKVFDRITDKDAKLVEVVRCGECIHRPSGTGVNHDVKFPDDECPCKCPDTWYSWMPHDDWYCASGKRKDGGHDDD